MQEPCGDGTERCRITVNNDEGRGHDRVSEAKSVVLDPDEDRRRFVCCTPLRRLLLRGSVSGARHVNALVRIGPSLGRSAALRRLATMRFAAVCLGAARYRRCHVSQRQARDLAFLERIGGQPVRRHSKAGARGAHPLVSRSRQGSRPAGTPVAARRAAETLPSPTASTNLQIGPSCRCREEGLGCPVLPDSPNPGSHS